jgi:RNA polymerase sigma factor (sigma-70 family)
MVDARAMFLPSDDLPRKLESAIVHHALWVGTSEKETAAMASGSAGAGLLGQLNTLFRFGVVGDLSDGQLVQRFLTARDGADQVAFTALVERHGPMVFGVCREVLGNAHDAQDAFQATFLVLARRAGSVRNADSLASWLHGVALRVAMRAKAMAARRRVYERRGAAIKAVELKRRGAAPEWWPELHEEIARLPERYREPVVLYYLEGLTTEDAALRIGCPHGTILSRLSRARERLRRRLDRRGLALSVAFLAAGSTPRATAALPGSLIDATVRAAIGFAGGAASEAALASATATELARGVLHIMTIPKLKILVATAMACGLTWGGLQTFGQFGSRTESRRPDGTVAGADESQSALTRSVDRLESALDESARRNAEMRKTLRDLRAQVKALTAGRPPAIVKSAATLFAEGIESDTIRAVGRLAEALKRHPPRLARDLGWNYETYMLDLVEGGTTLVADEPIPGNICSGMPVWSHDGSRIVFDTTGTEWPLGRLVAIEARDGRPTYTELGAGNHPTFSPDDGRIAFLLHPGGEPGSQPGIWVMRANGSGRRLVGEFGAPFWSPDGREFLINSYADRPASTVINLEAKEGGPVKVAGHQILSWPSWAGPGTLVSALATDGEPESIALLDVRKPGEAKVIEVLWKRSQDLDVVPRWPVYRHDTRRCYFVGAEPRKRTIYTVRRGEPQKARSMGVIEHFRPGMQAQQLGGLSSSPDGRYLLFQAHRPERE